MEIIKKGKLPDEKEYQATCDRCGTVMRFKQKEAQFHDDQRDGSFYSVKCPVCDYKINVDARLFR